MNDMMLLVWLVVFCGFGRIVIVLLMVFFSVLMNCFFVRYGLFLCVCLVVMVVLILFLIMFFFLRIRWFCCNLGSFIIFVNFLKLFLLNLVWVFEMYCGLYLNLICWFGIYGGKFFIYKFRNWFILIRWVLINVWWLRYVWFDLLWMMNKWFLFLVLLFNLMIKLVMFCRYLWYWKLFLLGSDMMIICFLLLVLKKKSIEVWSRRMVRVCYLLLYLLFFFF